MVRTGGPRGHGSGRAKSPEAEAARRAKIAASRRESKGKIRVIVAADYRLRGRTGDGVGASRAQIRDWNYRVGREHATRIDPSILRGPNPDKALNAHLNRLHPERVYFRSRVVEIVSE